ncbi:hypothetical protein ACQHIV_26905 [Kribbella sp. GL6]|uniref:hypothetical protein n=1 Tax=Kribbella sp. GL6 TaxID=3419765 RepID=UPI003CFDFB64
MRVRAVVLSGGLAVLLVGLFAAAGQLTPRAEPVPESRARFNDPRPAQVTPSRNPRREPDVDRGRPISDGVFIEVADGWKRVSSGPFTLALVSWERGAAFVLTGSTRPVTSVPLLRPDAEGFAQTMELYGVRIGRVHPLPAPNRNIVEAAAISFTGLRKLDDVTYSLSGECVRLRGAADTNDVSVSICWSAYVQDLGTVRPEAQRMIASVARSI